MELTITIRAPHGKALSNDLEEALKRVLGRAQVPFQMEEAPQNTQVIHLMDTSEAECRFVIRLIQRAGYDVKLPAP